MKVRPEKYASQIFVKTICDVFYLGYVVTFIESMSSKIGNEVPK